MTKQTQTQQNDFTEQDHEINYKDNCRTHPCILIRLHGAPPPAALVEGTGSPC